MADEDYKSKYDRLVDLSMRMRNYQKRCDQYPLSDDKKRKRELERQFDNSLEQEIKDRRSRQTNLF